MFERRGRARTCACAWARSRATAAARPRAGRGLQDMCVFFVLLNTGVARVALFATRSGLSGASADTQRCNHEQ